MAIANSSAFALVIVRPGALTCRNFGLAAEIPPGTYRTFTTCVFDMQLAYCAQNSQVYDYWPTCFISVALKSLAPACARLSQVLRKQFYVRSRSTFSRHALSRLAGRRATSYLTFSCASSNPKSSRFRVNDTALRLPSSTPRTRWCSG